MFGVEEDCSGGCVFGERCEEKAERLKRIANM
jgi:hypothetical protein